MKKIRKIRILDLWPKQCTVSRNTSELMH